MVEGPGPISCCPLSDRGTQGRIDSQCVQRHRLLVEGFLADGEALGFEQSHPVAHQSQGLGPKERLQSVLIRGLQGTILRVSPGIEGQSHPLGEGLGEAW